MPLVDVEEVEADYARSEREGSVNNFRRMTLNQWVEEYGEPPIPWQLWDRCVRRSAGLAGDLWVAVDAPPERNWASVAVSNGEWVELVKHELGVEWLVPAVLDLLEANDQVVGVVGGGSRALAGVLDSLEKELWDGAVLRYGADDIRKACGGFYDAVMEGRLLVHDGNAGPIRDALAGAERKVVAEAAWSWGRADMSVVLSPLMAVTLAHYAAATAEPAPVGFTEEDLERLYGGDGTEDSAGLVSAGAGESIKTPEREMKSWGF